MNIFRGAFTALITPMKSDSQIDYEGFRKNVKHQLSEGIDGLVPLGTTAETPTLDEKPGSEEDKLIEILNREIRYAIDAGKSRVVIGQDFFRLHSKEVTFAYSCGSMTDQLALRFRQEKEMSLEQSNRRAEYIEREVIKQITSKGLPYASRFYFDSHKRFWLKGIVNLGWGQLTNIYRLIEASRRLLNASGYNPTIKPFSGHKALIVRW